MGSAINDSMLRPSSFTSNLLLRVDAITGTISAGNRSVKKHVLCSKIYLAIYHEISEISNRYGTIQAYDSDKNCIGSEGLTQREAAERFNVAQPRISDIYQGRNRAIFCRQVDQYAGPGRAACEGKRGRSTLTICRWIPVVIPPATLLQSDTHL